MTPTIYSVSTLSEMLPFVMERIDGGRGLTKPLAFRHAICQQEYLAGQAVISDNIAVTVTAHGASGSSAGARF